MRFRLCLCVLPVTVVAASAHAQRWSLVNMAYASPQANPNGPWSYLWQDGTVEHMLGGPFPAQYGIQGEYLWWNGQEFPNAAAVDINATGGVINFQTFFFGPDRVRLDPQNTGAILVRFTAPVAGPFHFQGGFETCDTSPHTKHIRMIANNGQFGMPIINRDLTTGGQTFDIQNVNLAAGQTVEWLVWSLGDPSSLSTCLYVTATFGSGAACYANCDGSTSTPVLNVNDFICFQARFAAGDTYANCDNTTAPPVLNINDFICFQTEFAAGCQ